MEYFGLVASPSVPNPTTPSNSTAYATIVSSSTSSSPSNAVSAVASTASQLATSPCVELLARLVGEPAIRGDGTSKGQKKEDRSSTVECHGGVGNAGSAAAAVVMPTRKGEVGGGGGAGISTRQQGPEPSSPPPPDLIGMDDLLDGWTEDEMPSRWPSLVMHPEHQGDVIVLYKDRRNRRGQQPLLPQTAIDPTAEILAGNMAGCAVALAADAVLSSAASSSLSNGGGSGCAGVVQKEITEVVETGTGSKKLSFRRPIVSNMVSSKTVSRSNSSSSFTLPTRIGRRIVRTLPLEEQAGSGGGAAVEGAALGEEADGPRSVRSQSPPPLAMSGTRETLLAAHSSIGRVWTAGTTLESLLPSVRELGAPPPPPLSPPLPHKAEMVLTGIHISSSSPPSAYFSHGEAAGGSSTSSGGSNNNNSSSSSGALTSLPSFSSLLASAQGARGSFTASTACSSNSSVINAAGHDDAADGAAPRSLGGENGDGPVLAAAEIVGETQHMDQLFDMLELDLGIGGGYGESGFNVNTAGDTSNAGEVDKFRQDRAGLWRLGDGHGGGSGVEDSAGGGEIRQQVVAGSRVAGGKQNLQGAFGGSINGAVGYSASLWQILQVISIPVGGRREGGWEEVIMHCSPDSMKMRRAFGNLKSLQL